MKSNKYEIFGWYGAVAVLASYILVSLEIIGPHSLWFHFLNLSGGIGVALIAYRKGVLQPVVINGFRAIVALVAMIVLIFQP